MSMGSGASSWGNRSGTITEHFAKRSPGKHEEVRASKDPDRVHVGSEVLGSRTSEDPDGIHLRRLHDGSSCAWFDQFRQCSAAVAAAGGGDQAAGQVGRQMANDAEFSRDSESGPPFVPEIEDDLELQRERSRVLKHYDEVTVSRRDPGPPRDLSRLQFVAVNSGCKFKSKFYVESWLALAAYHGVVPDLVFCSEADAFGTKHRRMHVQGYQAWRKWPGQGSRAMLLLVKNTVVHLVQWRKWRGRCGAVLFGCEGRERLFVIFLHGAHGAIALQETFSDVVALWRRCPRGARVFIAGDWNVDLLPEYECDPYSALESRALRHAEERRLLRAMLQAVRCSVVDLAGVRGSPGGHFSEIALQAPITRIPTQGLATLLRPSLLDYCAVSEGFEVHVEACWNLAVADHAALVGELTCDLQERHYVWRVWQPEDGIDCLAVMHVEAREVEANFESMAGAVLKFQKVTQTQQSAKIRKEERLPLQARTFLRRAAGAEDPTDKAAYKKTAWGLLRAHVKEKQALKLTSKVQKGGCIRKICGLKQIKALQVSEDRTEREPTGMSRMICKWLEAKWQCHNLARREEVMNFLHAFTGLRAKWDSNDIETAFWNIKATGYISNDGTSINAWRFLHQARPTVLPEFLNSLCGNPSRMQEFTVTMKLKGKKTCSPTLEQIRSIMPMPPLLQLLDYLLSSALSMWIETHLGLPSSCFSGGLSGTQPADVSAGVSLLLQKGADDRGRAGVSQADVEQYYDRISPLRVARFLMARHCPAWLVGAVTIMQLCVRLNFSMGGELTTLAPRTSGSLTGSRVAGCLGRIIMNDCMLHSVRARTLMPFMADSQAVAFACWVDNVYAAGSSAEACVSNMRVFESRLVDFWGLRFKPDSKTYISSNPQQDADKHLHGWRWSVPFEVLGHAIGISGSLTHDLPRAEEACWKRYFLGAGSKGAAKLSMKVKLQDIDVVCWPSFAYRCTWWSVAKTSLAAVRSVQNAVVASCLRLPRQIGEDDAAFARRRNKEAAKWIGPQRCWARRVAANILSWDEHIRRASKTSWATILVRYRDSRWLQARRLLQKSASIFSGRLASRAAPSRPHTRWEEGVEHAKSLLSS